MGLRLNTSKYGMFSAEYIREMRLREQESMQRGVLNILGGISKGNSRKNIGNILASSSMINTRRSSLRLQTMFGDDEKIINDGCTYSLRGRRPDIENKVAIAKERECQAIKSKKAKEPEYASAEEVKNACEQFYRRNHEAVLSDAGNKIKCHNGFQGLKELSQTMEVQWVNDAFVFNEWVKDPEEDAFNRQMVNNQIKNILSSANVSIDDSDNLTFSIDPYSYEISANGNISEEKKKQIEEALNQGENGFNLYTHVYFCAKDKMGSTQLSQEGQLKRHMNDLFYQFYGVRLCECEKQGDDFITKDGRSVRKMIGTRHAQDQTTIFGVDETNLKHHYLDLLKPYSYDSGDKQTLEIAYTSTGLHDMHQDYDLGTGCTGWIEERRREREQKSGKEIYRLF